MSFGRGPHGFLAPRQPNEPLRSQGPQRAVEVPPDARFTVNPPMIGMGLTRLQQHFNPTQYDAIGNHWIDLDPTKRKKN